jgi:putative tricarboxylic transport membrane protein
LQNHRLAGALLAAAGLAVLVMAQGYPYGTADEPGPAYYPTVIAALLVVFGALVAAFDGPSERFRASTLWERGRPLAMLAALALAALLVERAGFRITLALLLFSLLALLERVPVWTAAAIAVVLPAASFALLHGVLQIALPVGPLGF